jgi:hypothetical protein
VEYTKFDFIELESRMELPVAGKVVGKTDGKSWSMGTKLCLDRSKELWCAVADNNYVPCMSKG